ncbi:uncharacterized protein LOC124445661 isoform X3 [Xenia sp. Carnegie-2017]|uniref:uncharacterized protein LOC124445661 isoform X3 n=1 Tax=Xenia sp. Carnegie-2017 TaxID=2897299 RepID=UPI001F04E2B9|nr:uncharacterized protein LOC124445661 isoform X3 [Xenia sp. Carnegie-2017]
MEIEIKAEFAKVMGNKDVATQVKENFNKVWRHRLLAYAEKNGKHSEDLKKMHNAIDSGILEEGECAGRAAIKIAQTVFKQPNSRRTPHVKEAVIKVVKVKLALYLYYKMSITILLHFCFSHNKKIQEQRTKFVDYWNFTSSIVKVALKRGQSEEDVKASFRQMFFCVVDTIVVQIDSRFESLNSRAFVSLLDHSKHELYSRNFPERELQSLQDSYGTFFNLQALKVN